MKIFTIGHSVHTKETFIDMLKAAEIEQLADVRAFPASRKHPQFAKSFMQEWLPEAGIAYTHMEQLGGRRKQSASVGVTLNNGWDNQSFHNYADYTLTDAFQSGVEALAKTAAGKRTAICCSERHPARCHRLLISNWLQANDWQVRHILDTSNDGVTIVPHELGRWGAMPIMEKDGTVVYPKI